MCPMQKEILLSGEAAVTLFRKTERKDRIARVSRAFLHALAANKSYQNPTELWISQDTHAAALLRHAGVQELFVKGEGSDFEKFRVFCTVMGDSTANPLKLQCHTALRELFDCTLALNETNCEAIWKTVCEKLMLERLTPRQLVPKCGVDTLLVSFEPWESPESLCAIEGVRVLPVFSPDAYFVPTGKDFSANVRALGAEICDFKSFCAALLASLDRFVRVGGRIATQSVLPAEFCRPNEYHAALYFEKAMAGEILAPQELALYRAQLWRVLAGAYAQRDMTLELCIGETMQNTEKTHTVQACFSAKMLRELFDYLKEQVGLPRVVAYTEQTERILTVAAWAARYPAREWGAQIALGVWQTGPAETRAQLRALASVTSLSSCVGVFPDARAPLSLWGTTLFHRTLCSELADWEAHGETDAGEENLCRVILRLTGENMREYYQL